MDGLSAASSGIAVVSLAVQLVDSVREIHRFLRRVSEAPKELKRLLDLLEQLELIIERIGELIDKQRKISGDADIDVSASVLSAMKTCESKLEMVQDLIQKSKKAASAKGQVARSLGSFRLACRNKDIEEVEGQLHDALNRLNLAMTMDLMAIHLQTMEGIGNLLEMTNRTRKAVSTVGNEMVLLRTESKRITNQSSAAFDKDMSQKFPSRKLSTKTSQKISGTFTVYNGLLGRVFVRKTLSHLRLDDKEWDSTEDASIQTDRTWILMPSFLSRSVEIEFKESFGFVQRSMRVRICIPDQHPIWRMCRAGDIQSIQSSFSRGEVSPFSINPYGNTLLDVAAGCFNPELCKLLLGLGLDKEIEDFWRPNVLYFSTITPAMVDELTSTYNLIAPRAGYADMSDFYSSLFHHHGIVRIEPQLLIRILKTWVTRKNIINFTQDFASPLAAAVNAWHRNPHLHKELLETIHHLLALEPNLSRSSKYGKLVQIMHLVDHPFDSLKLCDAWLNILEEHGVDVAQYLQQEMKYLTPAGPSRFIMPQRWWGFGDGPPSHIVVFFEGFKPRVYWEYATDPRGPAFEALSEFGNFETLNLSCWDIPLGKWPYMYSRWQEISCAMEVPWTSPIYHDETRVVELANERFARRCQKKALKIARAQGLHAGPKLPGSWID